MRSMLLLGGLCFVGCSVSSMMTPDVAVAPDTQPDSHVTGDALDGPNDSGLHPDACTLAYRAPGCAGDIPAICDDGKGGACGGAVCDCHGTIRFTNCDRSNVPYAYRVSLPAPDASLTCDPSQADAGRDR